jgi:hypothetical protein
MERIAKILLGAALGALAGAVLGAARTCSGQACRSRGPRLYYIIAFAFFGAAVAYYAWD